jgi:superfamily II DNA or RNA helicase
VLSRRPATWGWRTTDEEEVERRRLRAAGEALEIAGLERDHPRFGTFRVGSGSGGIYCVEIRSVVERNNSCDCTDHQVNGLGTCKHVEGVLAGLDRSARRRPGGRAAAGSSRQSERIEVFLQRRADPPQVRVQWPAEGASRSVARALLAPFFTAAGRLRHDPLAALPRLARELASAPQRVQRQVRLSRLLQPWMEGKRRQASREVARRRFLAEVESGRRNLDFLLHPLYPYQQEGMLHLVFTERALLADEMGLGKTVQAIAACELLRQLRGIERVLIVSPASLKAEWQEQISKFTGLPARLVQGPRALRLRQYEPGSFFYLVNYEQILYDGDEIQRRLAPDVIVLDEAQRIKNWQAKTAQAVKRLRSPYAFILTGTPLENRIDELYSLVQFLDPSILGPLFRFNRQFYELDEDGRPAGYKNLSELRRRLSPILLRRRKDEVEEQLPARTVKSYFVPMEDEQQVRYEEYRSRVAQLLHKARRRPLTPDEFERLQRWLACMRMICDTPYILDPECRVCPKLPEIGEILGERLAEPDTKALIFSEWERMLELVRELAEEMGVACAWHTGSVPQARRRLDIRRFKDDPACRLFLSTDSGGVGLNLQAANLVINVDLPWNPARLEQRIARAWRKHQVRPVHVVHLVSEGTIEHRMLPLLAQKQALADGVLDGRGEVENLALPSGRAAFLARVAAVLGDAQPVAVAPPIAAPPRPEMPERLRQDLLDRLGERLLLLELRSDPSGAAAIVAVVDRVTAAERAGVIELAAQSLAAAAPTSPGSPVGMERTGPGVVTPALEIVDRSTFAAVERLVDAGVLRFTAGERTVLHRSPDFGDGGREERRKRLEPALQLLDQGRRKVRMATVLAAGGFALEALAPLREGIETGLRSLALYHDGEAAAAQEVPLAWLEANLPPHDASDGTTLVARLRGGADALLRLDETEARSWIESGQQLTARLAAALDVLDH